MYPCRLWVRSWLSLMRRSGHVAAAPPRLWGLSPYAVEPVTTTGDVVRATSSNDSTTPVRSNGVRDPAIDGEQMPKGLGVVRTELLAAPEGYP